MLIAVIFRVSNINISFVIQCYRIFHIKWINELYPTIDISDAIPSVVSVERGKFNKIEVWRDCPFFCIMLLCQLFSFFVCHRYKAKITS